MLNDVIILKRIREGDIKAFEEVFRHFYAPLCLYAAGITNRMDVAEEIVQELFYVCWKDRQRLNILHSLKSYLYGATRNRSLQYCEQREVRERYRGAVSEEDAAGRNGNPHDALEYKELQELIDRTLRQLPPRRLRIFRMHRDEGKKYAEIATELALSVKTVEAEMTKALQHLRKEIENYTHIA